MSMYYGGSSGGGSYSSPYLSIGGNYSTHSSLGGYSRAPLSGGLYSGYSGYSGVGGYSGIRTSYVPSRTYTPLLGTINEGLGTRRTPTSNVIHRISPKLRARLSPKYKAQKPITINTEDIDVSRDKYGINRARPNDVKVYSSGAKSTSNSASGSNVSTSEPEGIERGRSTIKRSRPVVRLHTLKRKDRESPKKPLEEVENQEDKNEKSPPLDALMFAAKHSPKSKWRENIEEDLEFKDKKQNRKTPGEKLKEKFTIPDRRDDDEDILVQKELREKAREENLRQYSEAVPTAIKRHNSSKRHSMRKLPGTVTENGDNELPMMARKHSKRRSMISEHGIENEKMKLRRLSQEMLNEQAQIFDALIRGENLSTAQIDLSKIGIDDVNNIELDKIGSKRKKKSSSDDLNSNEKNSLTKTKSENSLNEKVGSIERERSPQSLTRRSSQKMRRSSSSGMLSTLCSIKEVPKEQAVHTLKSIDETPKNITVEVKSKQLKPKISTSVEVNNNEKNLVARVDDVIIEETKQPTKVKLANLKYDVVLEEVPKEATQSKGKVKESKAIPNPEFVVQEKSKLSSATKSVESIISKPTTLNGRLSEKKTDIKKPVLERQKHCDEEENNFWEVIGKRETIYYKERKKRLSEEIEKKRRAIFWSPEDELEVIEESTYQEETEESQKIPQTQVSQTKIGTPNSFNESDLSKEKNKPKNETTEKVSKLNTVKTESKSISPEKNLTSDLKKKSDESPKNVDTSNLTTIEKLETPKVIKNNTPDLTEKVDEKQKIETTNIKSEDKQKEISPDKVVSCIKKIDKETVIETPKIETSNIKPEEKPKEILSDKLVSNMKKPEKELNNDIKPNKTVQFDIKPISNEKTEEKKKRSIKKEEPLKLEKNKKEELSKSEENVKEIVNTEATLHKKSEEKTKIIKVEKEETSKSKENDKETVDIKSTLIEKIAEKDIQNIKPKIEESSKTAENMKETTDIKSSTLKTGEPKTENVKKEPIVEIKSVPITQDKNNDKAKKDIKNTNDNLSQPIKLEQSILNTDIVSKEVIVDKAEEKIKVPSKKEFSEHKNMNDPSTSTGQKAEEKEIITEIKELKNNKDEVKPELQTKTNENNTLIETEHSVNNDTKIEVSTTIVEEPIKSDSAPSEIIPAISDEGAAGGEEKGEPSEEVVTKPGKHPKCKMTPARMMIQGLPKVQVKDEAPLRPIYATPRPLQKRQPQRILTQLSSDEETESEEETSDEDEEETETSEEGSEVEEEEDEFYECENKNVKSGSDKDIRTSTSSNDSGFDSSVPTSPAGIICIKKG